MRASCTAVDDSLRDPFCLFPTAFTLLAEGFCAAARKYGLRSPSLCGGDGVLVFGDE